MKWHKGLIVLSIIICFTIVVFVWTSYNKDKVNQAIKRNNSTLSAPPKNKVLVGTIWTNGLADNEKKNFDLISEFQLTKSLPLNGWEEKISGMYLIADNIDFQKYLGKCVEINGKVKTGWEDIDQQNFEINGVWTYNRSAMIVDSIVVKDQGLCIGKYDRTENNNRGTSKGTEYKTAKGTLAFTKRLAPDISYDLELVLEKPFIDELNSTGNPVVTGRLDISPGTDGIYRQIIDNIGRQVEVGGYMEWGYAESRYLQVEKITVKTNQ